MHYPFKEIEARWQEWWSRDGLYTTMEIPRRKQYLLEMFLYTSGDIHMGHFRNYVVGDVMARYRMMQGYDLLHPMGFDAFGLPAEEAAMRRGVDPEEWTLNNIEMAKRTLGTMGLSYDWDREVVTCRPDYYRWTQWVFLKLFSRDLAYRDLALVNWCPRCRTVLANEQVEQGTCWRCHAPVVKRELRQWFFKITAYAQRLLDDLDRLDGWPEPVKTLQRNWIGRSEGAEIDFVLERSGEKLPVFTTRPDTVYGVTFMAMAPETPLARRLAEDSPRRVAICDYIEMAMKKTEIERTSTVSEKDGVFTGQYAINPLSGDRVQLWVADYVLPSYGTGVVMAVPAHDQRDFEMARKYDIPIKVVIQPRGKKLEPDAMEMAYVDPGVMVDSGPFDGLPSRDGIERITQYMAERRIGRQKVNFRLRDWLISRQRYWGAPIPMIHCSECGVVPVPQKDLPVLLPKGEVDFVPKGRSPLADVSDFMNVSCPRCGGQAQRDADTMDTFVCSSWYHLRYTDSHNDKEPFRTDMAANWLPVDLYIGGIEHACGHLLYFRFITKVLHDDGLLTADEPALRLFNHGMVLDDKGEVMSKSKGNVVSPAPLIAEHGADPARVAMLFAAPPEREIMWTEEGVTGATRFLDRIYRLLDDCNHSGRKSIDAAELSKRDTKLYRKLNWAIKRVSDDLEAMHLNTAIAAMMELVNELYRYRESNEADGVIVYCVEQLAVLLAPFAPHLAEEIWQRLGRESSIFHAGWIEHDPEALVEETVVMAVQVNGKLRSSVEVPTEVAEEELKEVILADARVAKYLRGKKVVRWIVVPGRLVNVVVR